MTGIWNETPRSSSWARREGRLSPTIGRKNHLPFVGLPDPKHSVLKLYGQEVNLFKLGRMPAQLVVDKDRQVRYVHYGHSMKDIPSNEEMWEILDQIG